MKNAKKNKHLSFEDRCTIEEFLNNNYNFTKISNRLSKSRTTIARDVKKHRFLRTKTIAIVSLVAMKTSHLMFVMAAQNLIIAENKDILILMILHLTNTKRT